KDAKICVQLDLGAGTQFNSIPYEQLFGKGTAPIEKPELRPFTGAFGGARVRGEWMAVVPHRGGVSPEQGILLGTLVIDFFRNRILLRDFVRQRLCILNEKAKLPETIEREASFVPITIRGGHLMVPIKINGNTETDFFYDTGASLFPISTTRSKWQ